MRPASQSRLRAPRSSHRSFRPPQVCTPARTSSPSVLTASRIAPAQVCDSGPRSSGSAGGSGRRRGDRFGEAFDNEVLSEETRRFLNDERHHLVLGYVGDLPAGFASAVEVFHPDKRCELFLNEIAVMEGGRRRGVARALINDLKRVGREQGCVSMWVLTDEDNAPAMGLYRSTGGRWDREQSVMFEYDLTTGEPT